MKKSALALATMAVAAGLTWSAQATLINISFTGGAITGSGEITQTTDVGGGIYVATAGTFSVSNLPGVVFQLDPVPGGQSTVTIHGIANTGGADLFGDNLIGNNFISSLGLVFTSPQVNGDVNGFNGDVINIWGNGGNSYTLAFGGPDFSPGLVVQDGIGTVTAVPEASTYVAAALLILPLGISAVRILRNKRQTNS